MVGLMELTAMALIIFSCTSAMAQLGFLIYLLKQKKREDNEQ